MMASDLYIPEGDWADCLEAPIRHVVLALRERGVNTRCSCGHAMTVACEFDLDYFAWIHRTMKDLGIQRYRIRSVSYVSGGGVTEEIELALPLATGDFVQT